MKPSKITIEQVSVVFTQSDGSKFTALDNISFQIESGALFGLLGANGAGKSTLVNVICGLIKPTIGKVQVMGKHAYTDRSKISPSLGYMSQHFSLYPDLTWQENLQFFAGLYGLSRAEVRSRLSQAGLELNLDCQKKLQVNSLSLGQKQWLSFFISTLHQPQVLILDEPTAGLDPLGKADFWRRIHQLRSDGVTVLVTTHYPEEAEYCDQIGLFDQGRLIGLDRPDALIKTSGVATIAELFLLQDQSNTTTR